MRAAAWIVVCATAASLASSLAGARVGASRARWSALAVSVFGIAAIIATRHGWEFEVRRPLWLLDAAKGRWLERGVEWSLSSLALLGAAGLRAFGGPMTGRAWWASSLLAAAALAALAWASS